MLSRCSVPHLPSVPQSSAPPSIDGHPTQGQTASVCANSSVSCAVLHMRVSVGACVCFCVSTSACLCQASPERPGKQRKNRTGHYLNSLQQNFWRVFLKHIINSSGQHTQGLCLSESMDTHSQMLLLHK